MAQREIAKTTLALAAALLTTALSPALATARSTSTHAGATALGATAAPSAGEATSEGQPAGGHSGHRDARAERYARRHAHHRGHRRLRYVSFDGRSLATWFGPGLYGHQTACGQVLSRQLAGIANRTLPCGTLVEVSYEGRHVTVPVIDRGPYSSIGASWDLTEMTAQLLNITETVHVRTRIVGHVKNTPTLGLLPGPGVPEESPIEEQAQQQQAGTTGGASAA